jgi:hypothetical protein
MSPTDFPECNARFGPPSEMAESQVMTISAYIGESKQGSVDGSRLAVTAWKPSAEEITDIINGNPVFLTCMGGLPPHFITTRFEQAINPA